MATPIRLSVYIDQAQLKGQVKSAFDDAFGGASGTTGPTQGMNALVASTRQLESAWNSVNRTIVTFSASLYAAERIVRGMKDIALPFQDILKAAEAQTRFQLSLGPVGQPRNLARAIDAMSAAPGNYLNLDQMRRVATGVTHIDALDMQFGLQSPDAQLRTVQQMADLVQRIGVSNPNLNPDIIQHAVETALEGNVRGLRQIRIDPQDLKTIAGGNLSNPNQMLDALETLMRGRVPDNLLNARSNLPSVNFQKATDDFERLFAAIGNDSNLVGQVSEKWKGLADVLNRYVLSEQWEQRARSLGDSMGHIFSQVIDAGETLLQRASGAKDKATTPDAIAGQVDTLLKSIAAGSDALPGLADRTGTALHGLTGSLQAFLKSVSMASESIEERTARFDNKTNLSGYLSPQSYIDQTNNRSLAIIDLVDKLAGKPVLGADPMSSVEASARLSAGEPLLKQLLYRLPQGWINGLAGNPDVIGIKADDGYEQFVQQITQQVIQGGYQARNGQFISPDTISQQIVLPAARRYGIKLGATTQPTTSSSAAQPESFQGLLSRTFDGAGIDADLAAGSGIYANKFQGLNRAIEQLGGELPDATDKFTKTMEDGENSLNAIFARFKITTSKDEAPGSFFEKIYDYRDQRMDQLLGYRGTLGDIANHYKGSDRGEQASAMIDKIDEDLANLNNGIHSAVQNALGHLRDAAGAWNVRAIDSLKGEDPSVRDAEIAKIMSGNTEVGRRVTMANLGISDSMQAWFPWMANLPQGVYEQIGGRGAIPSSAQARASLDEIEAHLANLKEQGLYAGATQTNVAGQQADYLRSMLPGMQNQLNGMNGIDAERMSAVLAKVKNQTDDLTLSSNAALQSFMKFGSTATTQIEDGLGNALADVIAGTGKVSQAFRAMANEILHDFTSMAVHSAFGQIPGSAGNATPQGGGWLGALLQYMHILPSGASGGGASTGGASYSSSGGDFTAANGAVWVPSFAAGGIARSPVLLAGERQDRVPEAIIPMLGHGGTIPIGVGADGSPHAILPSGMRIAGSWQGSGVRGYASGGVIGSTGPSYGSGMGLNIHNYYVGSEAEAHAHAASMGLTEKDVINIVSKDLLRGGATARGVARMGGR